MSGERNVDPADGAEDDLIEETEAVLEDIEDAITDIVAGPKSHED